MKPLPADRERGALASIQRFFRDELDTEVGDLRAALVLDFFQRELAPVFYNQGVTAAREFLEDRLLDLEPTCHATPGVRPTAK